MEPLEVVLPSFPAFDLNEALAEKNEIGQTDFVCLAAEICDLDSAYQDCIKEKLEVLVKVEVDDPSNSIDDNKDNWIMMKGLGNAKVIEPPEDWKPAPPKTEKGEPLFDTVDNPGNWSPFSFRAKFNEKNGKGNYSYHALPTGVTVVPLDKDNKRKVDDWKFHYQGWSEDDSAAKKIRHGATATNMFPKSRKGRLDYELLKIMGLTKRKIMECDALFFKQLI